MRFFIIATLLFVACRHSEPKTLVHVQASAPRPSLADPLALLPAESDVVFKIDLAAMRQSPLWATYEPLVREHLLPGFTGCGYNPLAEVSTVTLGIPLGAALGVFVLRGLDRDETLRCLRSEAETNTAATFEGDFVTLTNKSGHINMITFVDSKTMVMQGSNNPTKETLTRALAVGAPLRDDSAYLRAEENVPRGATVTMIVRPGSKAFAEAVVAKSGVRMRELYATVHITDVVSVRSSVVLESAEEAAAIVENLRLQAEAIRRYVTHFDARAAAETVTVDVSVNEAQIKQFVEMAKASGVNR